LREAAEAGRPVEVVDPATNRVYYLVSAEQFQRMAATLRDDFDPREFYPMIDKFSGYGSTIAKQPNTSKSARLRVAIERIPTDQ
jgi:hypothetical protein